MRLHRKAALARLGAALIASLGLLAFAAKTAPAHADTLILQGSTTFNSELIAGRQEAIEAAAHHTLTVIPNKSNVGLLALLKGEADLAMISTALANEAEIIRRASPDLPVARLQAFTVARAQAALVAHPSNLVQSISSEDLHRILSGAVTNWSELGGAATPIRVVASREGGGVVSSVEASVLGVGRHMTAPNQIRLQNGGQVVKVVEQEPGALGISVAKFADGRQLRHLSTDVSLDQQLSLVSLGDPSAAMLEVIAAFREEAAAMRPE